MEKQSGMSKNDIIKILNACYDKTVDGIPRVSPPAEEIAEEYLKKYPTAEQACRAMIKNQIIKCTTSGFLTGFGGVITLPVTLPANLTSVLYVQMRMIACAAYMAGFDLSGDETQTFVYACLAGVAVNEILKQAGLKFGVKLTNAMIKKVPGKVLTKINQKVGFRFITKFGTKGIINMGKLVPGVGAVIGGGMDFAETKTIGTRAYKWFFEGDYVCEETDDFEDPTEIISDESGIDGKKAKIDFSGIKNNVSRKIKNVNTGLFGKKNKPNSEEI